MYSRKGDGPRIKPWGTPALTEYSCKDFPSRTWRNYLLLRKDKIRPKTRPEIAQDLSLRRRSACQTLSKAFDIQNYTVQSARGLLKTLAILSDTTVRMTAVDWEDQSEINSQSDQQIYYLKVFQRFS